MNLTILALILMYAAGSFLLFAYLEQVFGGNKIVNALLSLLWIAIVVLFFFYQAIECARDLWKSRGAK